MRRRSRASSKLANARSRKAKAPTALTVRHSGSSASSRKTGAAQLAHERDEALEQLSGASEVLKVISSSLGDLKPVFQTMLAKAVGLCQAKFGVLWLREGDCFRSVALHNVPLSHRQAREREPLVQFGPHSGSGRAIRAKRVIHIADLTNDEGYLKRDPRLVALVEIGGARAAVFAPLLKNNEVIGILVLLRQTVGPFTDKQIALVQNFAAQAVIAIENTRLLNELRQRTADLSESLEQQTATSEVLEVISSSPGELQPVFDAMLDKAVRICRADAASLFLHENGIVRRAARHSAVADAIMPIAPSAKSGTMRSITSKQIIHISDYLADLAYREGDDYVVAAAERLGIRASLHVPMLKEQEVVGAFTIWRTKARAFTEKQIGLVSNFAAQAVIAIENTRLLNELRQRTDDLTEALVQRTATSDVLSIISSSPGELQPVFKAIMDKAVRICAAKNATLWVYKDGLFHSVVRLEDAGLARPQIGAWQARGDKTNRSHL
jgi:GAF domain-containing protein